MKVETPKSGAEALGAFNPERLSVPELRARLDADRAERASLRVKMEELQEEWDAAGGIGGIDLVPLLREWVAKQCEEERNLFRAQFGALGERGKGILTGSALRGKFDEMVAARVQMLNGERTSGLQMPLFTAFGDEFVRIWSGWAIEKFGDRSTADFVRKREEIGGAQKELRARLSVVEGEIRQIGDYIQSVLQ